MGCRGDKALEQIAITLEKIANSTIKVEDDRLDYGDYLEISNFIWCDGHGGVHEQTTDPFESGIKCRLTDWETLYIRKK